MTDLRPNYVEGDYSPRREKFDLEAVKEDLKYLKNRGVKILFYEIPQELYEFEIQLKWEYREDYSNLRIVSSMSQSELTGRINDFVRHYRYKVDREVCPRPDIQLYFDDIKNEINKHEPNEVNLASNKQG